MCDGVSPAERFRFAGPAMEGWVCGRHTDSY